jgi:YbbR domain-containing protein
MTAQKQANLLAAIACLLAAFALFVSVNSALDKTAQYEDDKLDRAISQQDRERVINNLRGNYGNNQ